MAAEEPATELASPWVRLVAVIIDALIVLRRRGWGGDCRIFSPLAVKRAPALWLIVAFIVVFVVQMVLLAFARADDREDSIKSSHS